MKEGTHSSSRLRDCLTRWPLRYTVPLLLLVLATAGVGANFLHERALERERIRQEGVQRLGVFAHLHALILREHLLRGDVDALRSSVAALALDPLIVDVRLAGPDGIVIAATEPDVVGRRSVAADALAGPDVLDLAGSQARADVTVPAAADNGDDALGRLVIVRDLGPRLVSSDLRQRAAFGRYFASILGIALLLWIVIDRLVWRRVRALGVATERIADGEFDARADTRGGDEIAATARLTNRAAERLERMQQANRRLSKALERLAAAEPGADLFDTLAAAVAEGLAGGYALIARRAVTNGDVLVVGTAGVGPWQRGHGVALDAMPCRACLDAPDHLLVIERGIMALHPGVAPGGATPLESFHGIAIADEHGQWSGFLAVFGEHPRADAAADRALMRTAAQRLAQEFERADREEDARRAAEALRERTELLELAVRGTADGLWDWTPHDDCFYLSPRGHELLSRANEGRACLLASFVAEVLPAAQRVRLDHELARVRAGRDFIDFELQLRTGSGALRWMRVRGIAVRAADGGVRRMVGSMSDVHEARMREQELAQARQLTSEAIESLDAGLMRLDAEDRIVLINTRYLEMFELPRERRYVGMFLRDVVELYYVLHPGSLAGRSVAAAVEERMRMHREHTGSWALDLGGRWVLVSDTLTADGGRVCLRTDISDLKTLQQALKMRTDYLELVVRGSSDGLWSWDGEQGEDLYLSPRFYDLLGYEPGEIPTTQRAFVAEIYHPADRERMRGILSYMIAHPEEGDILSTELRLRCRNGDYRWFHNRAAMTRRADGSPLRFAGSISDIHERWLREQELTVARQQLSDAIEAIDSGLMISDRDDRLVLCNRRYREMYEFSEALVQPGTHISELARDLMRRHPEYRQGLPIEEAVADRIGKHRAKMGRWELLLGDRWYQIGDYATGEGGVVSLRTDITHLKRVEQALRERTEFLEAAVRGSMDGIYAVDMKTDRVWFAPRFHELLGYADGELPSTWSAFADAHHHPDELQARRDAIAHMHAGQDAFHSREMRLRCKDGSWGWYHGRAAIIRDAEGRPQRLIGSLSDTSERHRREEELAQARQQLQDAIESLEVGIVMFDREERLVLCNRRFREMYGSTELDPAPGTRLEDLVRAHYAAHPDYRQDTELEDILAERVTEYRERRGSFEQQRGSRWLQITNNTTADGGVVSLRHDITAIKRTEQALRESEARLRTVFDNSPLGIFLAGTDGAIVFRNRVFAQLTGSSAREWRKHAWLAHVHEDERAWIGARWYEYVAAATGGFDIEYRTADTPERVVRLRAAPIVEQGQALGFAGTLEDVSAQRQAEIEQHRLQLQLQQAQKMDAIGHLTGGIAHDFNNILASILGYAALAGERRTTQEDAKLVTYLDAIRQSGERARELVAKMLAFSRSEPREVVTPTSVQPLIGEAVKLLKAIIPANIHIVTVSEPGLPPVLVDGVDLHQAIVNLAVNARDAIAGHGQITIAVRAPRQLRGQCASCRESFTDRYVEIAVSDTGAGIAPEHLPRLFEPFFSTKEVGKGTGMGLAVTHGVVHRVGGHILVDSAPGAGTTVRLLLRAAQAPVRAVPPTAQSPAAPVPRVARILVVDDEPLVMGLISEVLEGHGYAVVGYTDSRQALAWARSPEARFDLLVTDQTMPGLTGVELARELLAMRPMLPVVLCTGFSENVDARVAAAMGIRHFFSKPIPLERLVAAVDTLINDGPAPAIVA